MLGQPNFRPHVIEFIRGTGVKIDGVAVQDIGGAGPFTWVLPNDVCQLDIDAIGAGMGGGGGGTHATAQGGGGGGASGNYVIGAKVPVIPGSSLVITVGALAAGGAAGADGAVGGETSIAGLLALVIDDVTDGKLTFGPPVGGIGFAGTNTAGGNGGSVANWGVGGAGSAAAAAPGVGGSPNKIMASTDVLRVWGGLFACGPGWGGGGPSTDAAVAGGKALASPRSYGGGIYNMLQGYSGTTVDGSTTATISRGAGGMGGWGPFGRPGLGGAGGVVGANATGYGAGGGGGGGAFAGGSSSAGYVRFIYWSAR